MGLSREEITTLYAAGVEGMITLIEQLQSAERAPRSTARGRPRPRRA